MPILEFPGQRRANAADHMRAIAAAMDGHAFVATERAGLKAVEEPLQHLKTASAEVRLSFVFEAIARIRDSDSSAMKLVMKGIAGQLLRAGLPLSALDAVRLVEAVSGRQQPFPHKAVLTALEAVTMTPALREALSRLRPLIDNWHGAREMREAHERIDRLLEGAQEKTVESASSWTRIVFQELDGSPKQLFWRAIFLHARLLLQTTASRRWQTEALALVDRIGRPEFLAASRRWLALGPMPGMPHIVMPEEEAEYQLGFIWVLASLADAAIAHDLAGYAIACYRKIPQLGAVSHLVGNACVNALAALPGLEPVAALSRLSMRVKYDVARRLIEKALVESAGRNGVSRDDLEAMAVPTVGLNAAGERLESLGDCQARLSADGGLTWSRDGKPLKNPSAAVKANHAEALAALKKDAKELDTLLGTQRLRLERQLLLESTCAFERWKAWYLDHPVTGVFARNLIWEVGGRPAIWWQGSLIDWAGNSVTAAAGDPVRLWHPIRSDVQTVLSWRCWLQDHGVRQPFKQAHREVYLLTDAERLTATHSNRFAAHILRQHPFAALCRERGWQFKLMGQWDSHNTPYLELPRHQLRVEFDVDFPVTEEATVHGVYLTIATGRIEFHRLQPNPDRFEWPPAQPLRLEEIPPVVFSEVMRDADLFVGVSSIGSDPAWGVADRQDPHLAYWQNFAFGELSTAAESRKEVLEALLPRLAIRDRCRLEGRFLRVRGERNEYRIHLGSGNVLIEPGSRYLCIVQGAGDTAARVALPFDGDRLLSMILSKAFLLANDKAIKDESIRRQL